MSSLTQTQMPAGRNICGVQVIVPLLGAPGGGVMSRHSARSDKADRPRTSRGSVVVIQEAAKARTPTDPAFASTRPDALDQPVVKTLVIALVMIVDDKLGHGSSKVTFTEGNHTLETLLFDRPHEAF